MRPPPPPRPPTERPNSSTQFAGAHEWRRSCAPLPSWWGPARSSASSRMAGKLRSIGSQEIVGLTRRLEGPHLAHRGNDRRGTVEARAPFRRPGRPPFPFPPTGLAGGIQVASLRIALGPPPEA